MIPLTLFSIAWTSTPATFSGAILHSSRRLHKPVRQRLLLRLVLCVCLADLVSKQPSFPLFDTCWDLQPQGSRRATLLRVSNEADYTRRVGFQQCMYVPGGLQHQCAAFHASVYMSVSRATFYACFAVETPRPLPCTIPPPAHTPPFLFQCAQPVLYTCTRRPNSHRACSSCDLPQRVGKRRPQRLPGLERLLERVGDLGQRQRYPLNVILDPAGLALLVLLQPTATKFPPLPFLLAPVLAAAVVAACCSTQRARRSCCCCALIMMFVFKHAM